MTNSGAPTERRSLVEKLDARFYPDCEDHWDSRLFSDRVRSLLAPGLVALDVGAGRGGLPHMDLRASGARICGTDLDPAVLQNLQIDEGRTMGDGGAIPWPDESFDVVFSSFVWEHVEDPTAFLREAGRVLRPGGTYISLTPNRRHYVSLAARLTPHSFHEWYNSTRGRDEDDTFPTFHRLNTRRQIINAAHAAGLALTKLDVVERRPEYLRINPATYAAGILYERVVNSTERLADFRVSLIAELRKE